MLFAGVRLRKIDGQGTLGVRSIGKELSGEVVMEKLVGGNAS